MVDAAQKSFDEQLKEILGSPDTERIYANGFILTIGAGDIVIALKHSEKPFILNLSYTVAKTLAIKLGAMVSQLEEKTGNTIMTTDDITKALSEGGDK
ncbi:MAG: hypothetical protein KAI59_06590 [Planctomycetes bacterium]|nr:hypothetical protein [Planctomycetota bacterium]MCK5473684.1 hypothetical protein [Planctomycetota bacterium]